MVIRNKAITLLLSTSIITSVYGMEAPNPAEARPTLPSKQAPLVAVLHNHYEGQHKAVLLHCKKELKELFSDVDTSPSKETDKRLAGEIQNFLNLVIKDIQQNTQTSLASTLSKGKYSTKHPVAAEILRVLQDNAQVRNELYILYGLSCAANYAAEQYAQDKEFKMGDCELTIQPLIRKNIVTPLTGIQQELSEAEMLSQGEKILINAVCTSSITTKRDSAHESTSSVQAVSTDSGFIIQIYQGEHREVLTAFKTQLQALFNDRISSPSKEHDKNLITDLKPFIQQVNQDICNNTKKSLEVRLPKAKYSTKSPLAQAIGHALKQDICKNELALFFAIKALIDKVESDLTLCTKPELSTAIGTEFTQAFTRTPISTTGSIEERTQAVQTALVAALKQVASVQAVESKESTPDKAESDSKVDTEKEKDTPAKDTPPALSTDAGNPDSQGTNSAEDHESQDGEDDSRSRSSSNASSASSVSGEEGDQDNNDEEGDDKEDDKPRSLDKEDKEKSLTKTEELEKARKAAEDAKKKAKDSEPAISMPKVLIGLGIGATVAGFVLYNAHKKPNEKQTVTTR